MSRTIVTSSRVQRYSLPIRRIATDAPKTLLNRPTGDGFRVHTEQTFPSIRPRLVAVIVAGVTAIGSVLAVIAPPQLGKENLDSPLDRIRSLNPHLVDETGIPNFSLKIHSLSDGPYKFFRGTADLYYVWCCEHCADWLAPNRSADALLHGDVHPGNTGTYVAFPIDGQPRLAYSLVDFDEAFLGPFELDLLRAATSLRFAADENKLLLTDEQWRRIIDALIAGYRDSWRDVDPVNLSGREGALATADRAVSSNSLVTRLLAKANSEDAAKYVTKYAKGDPPSQFKKRRGKKKKPKDIMVRVSDEERAKVIAAFERAFDPNKREAGSFDRSSDAIDAKVLDVCRWVRVGSSGSQGLRKYLVLLEPPEGPNGRPSIFQLKHEPSPAGIRAGIAKSESKNDRSRYVAEAYSSLQLRPRRFVSWTTIDGMQYLVKPKDSFGKEPDTDDLFDFESIRSAADLIGRLVGIAHAKSKIKEEVTKLKKAIERKELPDEIMVRSAAVFDRFRRDYFAFKSDRRTRTHVEFAERWLRNPTD